MMTPEQIVKSSRHKREYMLLFFATLFASAVFASALTIAIFKEEVASFAKAEFVESYRKDHPDKAKLGDEAIFTLLPIDDRQLIEQILDLNSLLLAFAPLGLFLLIFLSVANLRGKLISNGIRVGPDQFPRLHHIWQELSVELGLKEVPELFVINGNGTLNAFATCVPGGRSFGAIYSDIVATALENNDEKVLRFILGHELGHIRLGHVHWWRFILSVPTRLPIIQYFIGLPLSRAQEYGCDKVGFLLAKDEDCQALLMLAAGKHLYRQVHVCQYDRCQPARRGFWGALYNLTAGHPPIYWRIAALRSKQQGQLFWFRNKVSESATDKITPQA